MTTPNEQYNADSYYENLDGTTDSRTGTPYPPANCSATSSPSLLVQVNRQADRINAIIAGLVAGRVVQEASLTIGIWPINYRLNGVSKTYNGGTGEAVTDDATTYIYLDSSNGLVKSEVGFPADPSTYLPLAEVVSANGSISSIADCRPIFQSGYQLSAGDGLSFANGEFSIAAGDIATAMLDDLAVTEAKLAALAVTEGKIADAAVTNGKIAASAITEVKIDDLAVTAAKLAASAVTEDKIGSLAVSNGKITASAVTAAKLADAVADAIPTVSISVGTESGDAIAVTIQVQDAQGNNNANRFAIQAWLSDAAYGAETSTAPDGTVSVSTGTLLEEETAKVRFQAITDATGQAILSIGHSGAQTWYLNVALNGRVVASSAIAFA